MLRRLVVTCAIFVMLSGCVAPQKNNPSTSALAPAAKAVPAAYSGTTDPYLVLALARLRMGQGHLSARKAMIVIDNAAKAGDPYALRFLADNLYRGNKAYPQNYPKALALYKTLADQGDHFAIVRVAQSYLNGVGVGEDKATAFEYFKRAALQGDPSAAYGVAYDYEHGLGVKKDFAAAREWYLRAAILGDRNAMKRLQDKPEF